MKSKIALITGAGKVNGLGYATGLDLIEKGYFVIFTSRATAAVEKAAAQDIKRGEEGEILPLDVTSDDSILEVFEKVSARWGKIDVLINNAAIFNPGKAEDNFLLRGRIADLQSVFEINTLGAIRMIQRFAPILKDDGCIVNVSSGMGALNGMTGDYPGYRMSKTALNAVTRMAASDLKSRGIKVNSVCPGWVRTEMGGAGASRSLKEGIVGIVWAATLGKGGPTGGFFRDGKPIDW